MNNPHWTPRGLDLINDYSPHLDTHEQRGRRHMTGLARFWLIYLAAICGIVFYVWASVAQAAQVTARMTLPTSNCDGSPVSAITAVELYSSPVTIPYDDAISGDCSGITDVPPPPSGFTPIVFDSFPQGATEIEIPLDLTPGVTYFFRARVQDTNGTWSPLSLQTIKTIALPIPGSPTVIIIGAL